MDKVLFTKALEHLELNGSLRKELVSSEAIKFLTKHNAPQSIIDFFNEFSYSQPIRFNNVYFNYVNEIASNNLEDENQACINNGLIIIGSGLNGDPIVLDLTTLTVGYVFHDELWEQESDDYNPKEHSFIDLKCSIGAFYLNIVTIDNYPVDAHQAEEFIKK